MGAKPRAPESLLHPLSLCFIFLQFLLNIGLKVSEMSSDLGFIFLAYMLELDTWGLS